MKLLKVNSSHKLLEITRRIRSEWKVEEDKELWFRAEDDRHIATRLQPKLFRPIPKGTTRKPVSELLRIEDDCQDEFWRCAAQLSDSKLEKDADWDWYFLSQHHGVPTRMLDWSDGALIALHFAIRDKPVPMTTDSTIYVLNPYWLLDHIKKQRPYDDAKRKWKEYCRSRREERLSRADWDDIYLTWRGSARKKLPLPHAPLLWDSPHVSRRIAAQRSRFMIFGSDPEWLSDLLEKNGAQLKAISIPKECVNTMRHELRDAGVTESVIFPDLDGLGREIEQEWKDRISEEPRSKGKK